MVMDVRVVGVGMTPFAKPGASESYVEMGSKAVKAALADAGLPYSAVQQAYAGYVYGDSTCGQAVLYPAGMTGIPIINVHNNCSTGSTALFLARQAVASGVVDCALAVGFEEMRPGMLGTNFPDQGSPNASAGRTDGRSAGESSQGSARRAVFRRRRRGIRQEVRYPRHHVCEDRT